MEKKHIISICGDLASGKGTVSKILKEDLNYFYIYKSIYFFYHFIVPKNSTFFNRICRLQAKKYTLYFTVYERKKPGKTPGQNIIYSVSSTP